MLRDIALHFIAVTGLISSAGAGDSALPRQQFKETATYPFIFKAAGYLASKGPLPMRFGAAAPPCAQRQPPAQPVLAKKEPAPVSNPDADHNTPVENRASMEPPVNTIETAASKREQPDFAKIPDEVLDFFKNTEGRPVRRAYLFDPIFQPVMPDELPKSKALSVQK